MKVAYHDYYRFLAVQDDYADHYDLDEDDYGGVFAADDDNDVVYATSDDTILPFSNANASNSNRLIGLHHNGKYKMSVHMTSQ